MATPDHDIEFQGAYFAVEIDGLTLGYFTACSGLSLEYDVMEYKNIAKAGSTKVVTKIPGKAKYTEVVMKRGFTPNRDLHDWFDEVVDATDKTPYKTGSIVVYDRTQKEVARFSLLNMWPSKLSASDLNAAQDEVMIEELTIQHEFLDWT
jgi:phage tail-like protein